MPPARPRDLARGEWAGASDNGRIVKTGAPALAASAAVTGGSYRLKVLYEYDSWSHLRRVKNAEARSAGVPTAVTRRP